MISLSVSGTVNKDALYINKASCDGPLAIFKARRISAIG